VSFVSLCRDITVLNSVYLMTVCSFLQQEDIHVMDDIAERLSCILRGKKAREPDVGSYCITMLHID